MLLYGFKSHPYWKRSRMNHNKNMIFKRKIVKEAGLFVKRFDLCSNVRRFVGFVAYGLSIFFYIKAQGIIGASKTNAYYSIAPFIGTLLSVIILEKKLTWSYFLGLTIMIGWTVIVVRDPIKVMHDEYGITTIGIVEFLSNVNSMDL